MKETETIAIGALYFNGMNTLYGIVFHVYYFKVIYK